MISWPGAQWLYEQFAWNLHTVLKVMVHESSWFYYALAGLFVLLVVA